jgi:hypothetical protein
VASRNACRESNVGTSSSDIGVAQADLRRSERVISQGGVDFVALMIYFMQRCFSDENKYVLKFLLRRAPPTRITKLFSDGRRPANFVRAD